MGTIFVWLYVICFQFYDVQSADLLLYESIDNYTTTSLASPLGLLNTKFNKNLKTFIYAFGLNNNARMPGTIAIIETFMEYKKQNDINFILLDWEKEASGDISLIFIEYVMKNAPNTKKVGEQLGDALISLKLNLDQVHLVGHSLGAHVVGYAGRKTRSKGQSVGRITGLDPAGELFEKPAVFRELQKSDATFVMILHTNSRLYGTSNNVAHVDIWPNCDMTYQPGCPLIFIDGCSHNRAPEYFKESLNSPKAFSAIEAKSCDEWKTLNDTNSHTIINFGVEIDRKSRGIFYLRTNSVSPFGKGVNGLLDD